MISRIAGKLVGLSEEHATLKVGGIYYDILVPSGLVDTLKPFVDTDKEIALFTIYYIEAGDMKSSHYPRLIGFTDAVDKEFFQLFISVQGLGVKKGLKSLVMPINQIAQYIEDKDAHGLARLPGVGARLAEKIVAELHGKTAKFALAQNKRPLTSSREEGIDEIAAEALEALIQLQYSRSEAETMINTALRGKPKVKSAGELIAVVFAGSRG